MSTFRRPMSASEKYFVALNELRPPFVIQLVLEGDGDPSPESLDDALVAAAEVNPGSSLIIDEAPDALGWTVGPEPTLTLIDAPEFEAASGEGAPFFTWPLDARKGPTCELVRVRGKEKTYLIFRALHAVMDGQGTILWVKDVMRCLRGEPPIGHPSPLITDRLITEMGLPRRPNLKEDAIHPFGTVDPSAIRAYHWRRISSERALDPLASGRIAVGLAELARRGGREGVVRINLPTDLRHYRPEARGTGNLFTALFLEVPPGATAEAMGLKIVQLLYKREGLKTVGIAFTEKTGSLDAFRVKVFWDLHHMHDLGRYAFSATLSHLGVLPSAELSGPGFEATSAFFAPLVGDSGCVVSLNGFDDWTEAAVGLSERFGSGQQLDDLGGDHPPGDRVASRPSTFPLRLDQSAGWCMLKKITPRAALSNLDQ